MAGKKKSVGTKIKNIIARIENFFAKRILNALDNAKDRKICGISLVKYVPSNFRDDKNKVGGTGSQSTPYICLKRVFSKVDISPDDVFIDVGCGKGRVLAFMQDEGYTCSLHGVEINEISGAIAKEWSGKYDNVQVTVGDAFAVDYNPYTVLFLGRPFLPETFLEFIEKLESSLTHPITFIYWVDQQSGRLLKDRAGWELKFREVVERINGIRIASRAQGYSIWTYTPSK